MADSQSSYAWKRTVQPSNRYIAAQCPGDKQPNFYVLYANENIIRTCEKTEFNRNTDRRGSLCRDCGSEPITRKKLYELFREMNS